MKILTRYVVREHAGPLVFALSALTALLLLNQVAKQFGNLVGKGLSWSIIGEFFLLSIPFIVAMTLPMAVLVAVLYAFSRMAVENEITALRATGLSMVRLVGPVMGGGAVLALVLLLFNDQVLPRSNHRLRTLQSDIARKKPTFALRPQVINEVVPGKLFLRAARIDEASNGLLDVTIYNFDDPAHRKTIYADSGTMGLTADRRDLVMTLHDGYMQQMPRDDLGQLQRLYFRVNVVHVRGVGNQFQETEKDSYKSEREMSMCEMDSMYQQNVYELGSARTEMAVLLANSAHLAATGAERKAPPPPPMVPRLTSGAVYCRLIRDVGAQMARLTGHRPRAEQVATTPSPASASPTAPSAAPPAPPEAPPAVSRPSPSSGAAASAGHPDSAANRLSAAPAREPAAQRAAPPHHQNFIEVPMPKEPPPHPASPRPSNGRNLAKDATTALSRPPATSPIAARPPAGPGGSSPSSGGMRRGVEPPGAVRAVVPPAAIAQAYVAPPRPRVSPFATTSQVEITRARITDAKMSTARYQVEIHKKFALAAACIVFVLLGAPIAIRHPRGGVGLVIGVSIVVFALYYVFLIAGEDLANRLLVSPLLAMWGANILFTIVGAAMLVRVQRSGSTPRGGEPSVVLDWLRRLTSRLGRAAGMAGARQRLA